MWEILAQESPLPFTTLLSKCRGSYTPLIFYATKIKQCARPVHESGTSLATVRELCFHLSKTTRQCSSNTQNLMQRYRKSGDFSLPWKISNTSRMPTLTMGLCSYQIWCRPLIFHHWTKMTSLDGLRITTLNSFKTIASRSERVKTIPHQKTKRTMCIIKRARCLMRGYRLLIRIHRVSMSIGGGICGRWVIL